LNGPGLNGPLLNWPVLNQPLFAAPEELMPTECTFTLPTGKKCRCMATRDHAFCRHHGAPRSTRKPRRDPDVWSRRACWRDVGRSAATIAKEDAVLNAVEVLRALQENCISDRTAGRLLRVLLQRWDDLPLMPTPATGWVPREPEPSALSPAPTLPSPALAAPPNNQIANLDDLRSLIDDLLATPADGRP
jgi:hypothetical protein